jgi:AraC-like DNA-binding protein
VTSRRVPALRVAGIGRILFWQGGSLWIGRDAGHSRPHAHHALQISLSLDEGGSVFLRRAGEQEWSGYRGAVIRSHSRHEFDGRGGSVAQVFVEPETAPGRALTARFASEDISALPAADLAMGAELRSCRAGRRADDAALLGAARRFVAALAGSVAAPPPPNARVDAAVGFISRRLDTGIALADVAAHVHLSPSRLRHLFVQETGSTYRGYVLWLRMNRAVAAMMGGHSWTEAAHEAGFADSAHLSRTFRRMFGVSPAMIVRE